MSRGSNQKSKIATNSKSAPSEETELRFINYEEEAEVDSSNGQQQQTVEKPQRNSSKFIERKPRSDNEVELSLEVEIDESLRDLLSTQPNDFSDLLDVTIIQQTNSRQQTKINVNYNEVSEFIEMLNHHNGHDKFINKIHSNTQNKNKNQQFGESFGGKEFFDSENRTDTDEPSLVQDKTTVYTTPYTFNNIKKTLPCLNPHPSDEKPGTPCLCQHCGMVGVLVESQKRPAIPHSPNPKFSPQKKSAHNKYENLKSKSKSETNLLLLKELSQKIMALENRLNQQEESSVRKDYFKYVIHKLLSQYSTKLGEGKEVKTVNIATQYSKTATRDERYRPKNRNYHAHTLKVENSDESCYSDSSLLKKKIPEKRRMSRSRTNDYEFRRDKDSSNTMNDLKYKITNLIEEKIKNPKKNRRDLKTEKHNEILKLPPNMDDIKIYDNKAIYSTRESTLSPFRKQHRLDENMSSQTIKQLCDLVYNKYQERHSAKKVDDSVFRKNIEAHKKCLNVKDVPEKLLGKSGPCESGKLQEKKKDKLDVAYVNPAVKAWQDESTEGEFEWNRRGKKTKHTIQEKIKYLKLLARKKNVDETELWNNILNQAKKHIKSNEDTVSIQLPCGLSNREISELELTLSNLKEIVKKSRNVKKKSSCLSIELNYKTSSDNYIMKRNVRKSNKVKGVK